MTEKDPGPDQSTTFRLRQSDPGLDNKSPVLKKM